ncbi:MAG: zinc-binding dehydrogenase [Opitutaceae bacterium]|jgi:NADPH:quinone reductase-like Zn-dependent oxidoreductase
MRAIRITDVNRIEMQELPIPEAKAGEVLVQVRMAALNHRDVWIKKGQYAGLKFPFTPGSDGAGTVVSCGDGVTKDWMGKEVIINPSLDWGRNERAQSQRFSILGLPRDGTFAEFVTVPASNLVNRPEWLSWQESAALPLAGLTAWRVVSTRARLKKGERVLITGIGGGVALLALRFARALGIDVWVTSSSDEKIARAVSLGASGGVNYTLPNWAQEASGAVPALFDVIIDGAGGPEFDRLLDVCAPGGRVVVYGATRGNVPELAMRKIFMKQASILGSTMGSQKDFHSMMEFVSEQRIRPVVSEEFTFARAPEAFALLERGNQFGKIVLSITKGD